MSKFRSDAKVTVLLPTFNRAHHIAEAIDSVLAQSHAPNEIFVLDDGSTDDTAAVCAKFGKAVRYIRLVRNMGKSAAINKGLEHATGAYIWVMDDDDIAPPDALETLLAPMLAAPKIGFTFGGLQKFRDDGNGGRVFEPVGARPAPDPRSLFVRLMEDCFITGQPCVLFRRRCFDAIGRIDASIIASVDYNILLQVARRFEGADVGKVVLWQRQHTGLRGPAATRYTVDQRIVRWMAFDARLLSQLLPQLSLGELLGERTSRRHLPPIRRRRALFQKAVIAARKNLWPLAIASLWRARAAAADAPLEAEDRFILSQMLGSRYGIDDFLANKRVQRLLASAAGGGELGAGVRTAIASRLTFWLGGARSLADFARAWTILTTLNQFVGLKTSARLVLRAVAKRAGLAGPGERADHAAPAAAPIQSGAQRTAKTAR